MPSRGEDVVLARVLCANEAAMNTLLEVVRGLIASHDDLLVTVEGLSQELAAVSSELAAVKADARATPARQAEDTLRQAAVLADRAAALLHHSQADGAVPVRLHSVDG